MLTASNLACSSSGARRIRSIKLSAMLAAKATRSTFSCPSTCLLPALGRIAYQNKAIVVAARHHTPIVWAETFGDKASCGTRPHSRQLAACGWRNR
jgi:hypothetical protein